MKQEVDFETWYGLLCSLVDRKVDVDTAREDYDSGLSPEASADEFIKDWKQ